MEHQQDWTQVTWTKSASVIQKENRQYRGIKAPSKQNAPGTSTLRKLDAAGTDSDIESLAHAKVSLDFKISLQKARLAKNMSQTDLARAICEVPKVVNEYESGKAIPNQAIVHKMNKVLGVRLTLNKPKK